MLVNKMDMVPVFLGFVIGKTDVTSKIAQITNYIKCHVMVI